MRTRKKLKIPAFEKLIEAIEDIYFGAQAVKALKEDHELISHKEVKRKLSKK